MNENIKRFEVGKTYATCSIGNTDCIISAKILRRTASTVTVEMVRGGVCGEKIRTFRISKALTGYIGAEAIKPWGSYSMAPTISADRAL